ncbi:MAG: hypothetical protein K0S65_1045, partial [Labilithrix sp.]|nr:hypothetical protein [Labilithrix sp.]
MRRVRTTVESICSFVGKDRASGVRASSAEDEHPSMSKDGAFEPTTLDLSLLVVENTDFVFRSLRRAGLDFAT